MNEKFRSVTSHSSDDKVKVVYSWHGPRGPVWNTELPNILTLASSAEGINPRMESRNFWTDDIWQKQFSKSKDKYELYTAQTIESEDKRPFIYPFSMTWRVEFQKYFLTNSGLLEFSHMPHWLIHLCRVSNGYILIDHSVEAFMSDSELNAMYSYFHENHNLPMYKIIYLTGTINASFVYEAWCERHSIADIREHRMHVIPYASSREIFHNFMVNGRSVATEGDKLDIDWVEEPEYDVTVVPEKLFLSWNRRLRLHRIVTALTLEKLDVIDRSYVSFAKQSDENSSQTFTEDIRQIKENNNLYGMRFTDHFDDTLISKFSSRLPLIIDGETDVNIMCEDFGYTKDYYANSLVSLVTETNYDAVECTLTEKSFKPLYNKHPFLIIGAPGAMQGLRDLGFRTFGDLWDESYDSETEPGKRLQKIKNVIAQISTWDDQQILNFKLRVKPILDHNYNLFKESGAIDVTNNMYNHITKNFNTEWTDWCDGRPGYCKSPIYDPNTGNNTTQGVPKNEQQP